MRLKRNRPGKASVWDWFEITSWAALNSHDLLRDDYRMKRNFISGESPSDQLFRWAAQFHAHVTIRSAACTQTASEQRCQFSWRLIGSKSPCACLAGSNCASLPGESELRHLGIRSVSGPSRTIPRNHSYPGACRFLPIEASAARASFAVPFCFRSPMSSPRSL